MAIQFELYKTPRPKDEEDKEVYHARVVNFQHIDVYKRQHQILHPCTPMGMVEAD